MKKEDCIHPEYALVPGENMPLVYGSTATQRCTLCEAWRAHSHTSQPDNSYSNRWRDGSEYAEAIKPVEVW